MRYTVIACMSQTSSSMSAAVGPPRLIVTTRKPSGTVAALVADVTAEVEWLSSNGSGAKNASRTAVVASVRSSALMSAKVTLAKTMLTFLLVV